MLRKVTSTSRFIRWETLLPTVSVVIPALNEAENIEHVIESVPRADLLALGWQTQIIVVDNASTDGTGDLARAAGVDVIFQPVRGYGSAYKAGFDAAVGEVIVTGDADRTYPLDHLPELLTTFVQRHLDFMTTNRLIDSNSDAMKPSHTWGNRVLSLVSRALFANGVADSQSGMWVFRSSLWPVLDVRATGMAFSQELKNEAFRRNFRCAELPIEYRKRGGQVKLNALRDGWSNLTQLFSHRLRKVQPYEGVLALAPLQFPAVAPVVRSSTEIERIDLRQWDAEFTRGAAGIHRF
jgi:glycosyltransferase involved in cell wall biosynthesis